MCPGLLSGANPVFFIVNIQISCLPQEMANVADGHLSHPPRSPVLTREEVADGFQIDGFVSPGLRNLHLEKPCLLVEQKYSISHESESEILLSHVPLCDPMGCSPWNSPGQNTGVGNLSRLQGIVPTQG